MGNENNILIVLANHDFQDREYLDTYSALQSAGAEIKIAALSNEDCVGIQNTTVSTNYTFDEVDVEQYDALVLIGGLGIEGYLHDDAVHNIVRGCFKLGKIVAAICWAPAILANAGILQGKRATCWSGASVDLEKNGAFYVDEAVVVDGNIITANGPDAALLFGGKIVSSL